MPYRSMPMVEPVDPREVRELAAIAEGARHRARRAAVGVATVLTATFLSIFAMAASTPPRPKLVCHVVTMQYEDARHIPAGSFTSCRTVAPH